MYTNRNILIANIFCLLFLFSKPVQGQHDRFSERYSILFKSDTIIVKTGQFVFNSLTVNNNSNQKLLLSIKYILPNGWNFVTQPNPTIEVNRGDFVSLPFRISPSKSALGDIKYPVTVLLKDELSGKELNETFFVKIKQNDSWHASLLKENILVDEKDSLSKFSLKIKNNGNKRELYEISYKSDLKLGLPDNGTQLMIWPGKDTTLAIYIGTKHKTVNSSTVTFFVKTKKETILLNGNVYYTSDVYQQYKSKFDFFPLSVEYFGINGLGKNTAYNYIDINGNYNISNEKTIDFRVRTNAFNPDYILQTQFLNFRYSSEKLKLNVGTQNRFLNHQINGLGVSLTFLNKTKKEYEFYSVKSTFNDEIVYGFRNENRQMPNTRLANNLMFIKNKFNNEENFFAIHNYEFKKDANKLVTISGGYSSQKLINNQLQLFGYMYGYRIERKTNKFQLQSAYQFYSDKFFGLMKGVSLGNHEFRIISKQNYLSLFSESNTRQPYVFSVEDLTGKLNFRNREFGLRLGAHKNMINSNIEFTYFQQFQENNLFGKLNGYKSSLNFNKSSLNSITSFRFNYIKSNIDEVKDKKLTNTYSAFFQMKYYDFGINATYTYGPTFYFDFITFAQTNIYPKYHNLSVFYEFKNKSRTFSDRINLASINNPINNKPILLVRNEVEFESKKLKSEVSIFTNVNVFDPLNYPSVNISLKKMINIPMFFKQKYYSASFFFFKDKNNNNIFDKDEEPISDAIIKINDHTFKSNKKGMVFMKNVDEDQYIVDYSKIQNLRGWIVAGNQKDTIILDRNLSIGVPFKQSKSVSGSVVFEIENSKKTTNESRGGILIMAINKKGKIYQTSTNENGEFFFNLQEEAYNIQIPTNIFDEGFMIERSIFPVDLRNEEDAYIKFKVIQKKRTINIKRD